MKFNLISPSHPFRGGISHHTTLLFRYLKKKHEERFSWKELVGVIESFASSSTGQ